MDIFFCQFCGHRLIRKTLENRNRLFCPACQKPIYENPVPATAAVIIRKNREILLVKRKVNPQKGKWCLPGGYVEIGETPEQCCLRELKEETNLEGGIERLVGVYLSENPIYQSVLVAGFQLKNVRGQVRAGDDSEEVGYFDLDDLPLVAFRSHLALIADVVKTLNLRRPGPALGDKHFRFGAYVISSLNHVEIIRKACRAGARIVQYRDKISSKKVLIENASLIREIAGKYRSIFIFNDDLDIALVSGADGVHLGQDDIPVALARSITPENFIVGVSTHSLEQALAAEKAGADYIAVGPVFATPTKADYTPIGPEIVGQVVRAVSIPVVAIGGLNLNNLGELIKTGVKNVAMVREFQRNTGQVVREINRRFGGK